MKDYSTMSDELDILKAQMQVLTSQLSKDAIVSEKMFRTTLNTRVKKLIPSRSTAIAGILICGIILPAFFIYEAVVNHTFSMPLLIASLIPCFYGALRSIRPLTSHIDDTIQQGTLTQLSAELTKLRRTNAIDGILTTILVLGWMIWFFIYDWAELSTSLSKIIGVAFIFCFVLVTLSTHFIRVASTSREALADIENMTK